MENGKIDSKYLVSVCIPSYNRPIELKRLLESIDASGVNATDLEIVIREDMSPKRSEIAKVVYEYEQQSEYDINYFENDKNYGYDRNLRSVAKVASGEWIIFMGDDDWFPPGALDQFMNFLREQPELGYVLRRHRSIYKDGSQEAFRYSEGDVFFESGEKTIVEMFRRSLFISGFTFRKRWFADYDCSDFDGTLLFHIYIMSCVCKDHKACYSDILIVEADDEGTYHYGVSDAEKKFCDPAGNSAFYVFLELTKTTSELIDKKLNINITDEVLISYSKYSYGFLRTQRDGGVKNFNLFVKKLRELGFDRTFHFNLYYWALLLLGKKNCEKMITFLKKMIGHTPRL